MPKLRIFLRGMAKIHIHTEPAVQVPCMWSMPERV